MKIEKVGVVYGELRSHGFNNMTHGISLEASLSPGDTAREVRTRLQELAQQEVKRLFGETVEEKNELDIPF